ncbi:UNVERIFIED_CONTAM: hypothetical protein DQE83_27845, partial [Escherichia coli]
RRHLEERLQRPRLLDRDRGLQPLGLVVPGPSREEQPRLGQRGRAAEHRMVRRHVEARPRLARDDVARHRPGQRRLAHALRPRDQPGVM